MHGLKTFCLPFYIQFLRLESCPFSIKLVRFFCTISNTVFYITVVSNAFFLLFQNQNNVLNGETKYVILHAFKTAKLQHSLELSPGDCSLVPLTTNY